MFDLSSLRRARLAKMVAGLGLVGCVAACSSSGTSAVTNPNFFFAKQDRKTQVLSGQYNPAGFSGGQVKQLIGSICEDKRTASFNQAAQSELVSFTALCRGGVSPRFSLVSFERRTSSTVLVEATGSDGNGNILFTQYEAKVGPGGVTPIPVTQPEAAPQDSTAESETQPVKKTSSAASRCRTSITIYCKDSSGGGVIPNVTPEEG